MSVITESQDIYVSTQPSVTSGSGTNNFDNFKVCFSAEPLYCASDEYFRLSLTQFNAYRNFYLVNRTNNFVYLSYDDGGTPRQNIPVEITPQDYGGIGGTTGVSTAFGNALITAIHRASGTTGFTLTDNTTPTSTGSTGDRKLNITLNKTAHGLTNMKITCPHFYGAVNSINDSGGDVVNIDPRNFNDSYALLGGKFTTTNSNGLTIAQMFQSFNITITTDAIQVQGFYPMQRTTMPFLYVRVENAGSNQESINLSNDRGRQGTHMIQSNIVGKIPVGDSFVSAQYEYLSPFFVNLLNNSISELKIRLTDHHDRPIEEVATDQDSLGNLFCDFTLKLHKVKRTERPMLLDTPPPPQPVFSSLGVVGRNNRIPINSYGE